MGYAQAGFEVVGVDIVHQKNYPFEFHQGDAIEFIHEHGHEFSVIHASPPRQAYSEATPIEIRKRLPELIGPTRQAIESTGRPYAIENVENARRHLHAPLLLCGTMFELPIWRHRFFEVSPFWILSPSPCLHRGRPVVLHPGSNARKGRGSESIEEARSAMGIHWMTSDEIYEAIPPAYTEYIGKQLLVSMSFLV